MPDNKKIKNQKSKIKDTDKRLKSEASGRTELVRGRRALKVASSSVKTRITEVKESKTVAKEKSRLTTNVYDQEGKVVGKVDLPSEIFDVKVSPHLLAQAVRVYLANQRMGSASTKTRGEVRGSTRKIYRQKGTGRARHGAIRAPIFVGGGIVFGPRPRDFSLKLPRKMKRLALFGALTQKYQEQQIIVVDTLEDMKAKTREMAKILKNLHILNGKKKTQKILLVLPNSGVKNVIYAARNIEDITIDMAQNLNTYEVLRNRYLVIMRSSIPVLSDTFLKKEQGSQEGRRQ